MGVVHPIVLENYKWDYPASLIELDLEPLYKDFKWSVSRNRNDLNINICFYFVLIYVKKNIDYHNFFH
jgi:hypothetical protein